jgi:hypothetical protein
MNKKSQGIRQLPLHGIPQPEIRKLLKEAKTEDADWEKGRIWGLIYHAGESHTALLNEAYRMFSSENALGLTAFPSLRKLEAEVVSMPTFPFPILSNRNCPDRNWLHTGSLAYRHCNQSLRILDFIP